MPTQVETGRVASGAAAQVTPESSLVQVRELTKSYTAGESRKKSRINAVDGVSFDVAEGEFFTLLGPSGCGKTTTLRAVAGLVVPDSGEIAVGGRPLFSSARGVNVPVNQRGISMVFQSYAIWPHMTVFENVAFPLRVVKRSRRLAKSAIREKVLQALAVVQLDEYADRRSTALSGGQQQRLALARALVAEPALMLLDEPLSNLDAKLRESVRFELQRLQGSFGFTSMYVTHDQVEALALSTRIAVMSQGRIQQVGRPMEIYENPATEFVADFIGRSNFLRGTITELLPDGICTVATEPGRLSAFGAAGRGVGETVLVAIRPERVSLAPWSRAGGAPEAWKGTVESRQFLGEYIDYMLLVGDGIRIQARANPALRLDPGDAVSVALPAEYCRMLQPDVDASPATAAATRR